LINYNDYVLNVQGHARKLFS